MTNNQHTRSHEYTDAELEAFEAEQAAIWGKPAEPARRGRKVVRIVAIVILAYIALRMLGVVVVVGA